MTSHHYRRAAALLVSASLLVAVAATAVASPASAAKPKPKCGGKTATIVGTDKSEVIRGTAKRDVIVAKGGKDRIYGRGGDDVICGGAGSDVIYGGPGRDLIAGGAGADRIYGGAGRDTLKGHEGHDLLIGGAGNDNIFGYTGDDRLLGGGGLDLLGGDGGNDLCQPGARPGPHYNCERVPRVPPRNLAIAFSDLDRDGRYGSGDVLISRLFDTNGDGIPSPGDEIFMGKYPLDLKMSAFADWGIDRHTVTGLVEWYHPYNRDHMGVTTEVSENHWGEWTATTGDAFEEDDRLGNGPFTTIVDNGNGDPIDWMRVDAVSPSEPASPVDHLERRSGSDDPFIDVVVYP